MNPATTQKETTALMGAVTAPATHDLMNVLAIIGEHAGLLSDLLRFSKEAPLSESQLTKGLTAIEAQVARGRTLLSLLNRLAHATDGLLTHEEPVPCDTGAALEEMVSLTQRRFHARLENPVPDHTITCDPMSLRLLLYRLVELTTHPTQAEETPITSRYRDKALLITFHGHHAVAVPQPLVTLSESLNTHLSCAHHDLILTIPAS